MNPYRRVAHARRSVRGASEDGQRATQGSWASFFWSAVLGGWAIALVAWLIQSSGVVIGQIALIWTLVFAVGLLGLDHSVSTTIEVMCAAINDRREEAAVPDRWLDSGPARRHIARSVTRQATFAG